MITLKLAGALACATVASALCAGEAGAACPREKSAATGMMVERCPPAPAPVPGVAPPKPAPTALDAWGVSAEDWLTLTGPALRRRLDVKGRRAEILAAADRGDVHAMALAAGAYSSDAWGPKDGSASYRYAAQAAAAGDPRAMHIVGNCFTEGVGVAKDPIEGLRWFRMAADRNYVPAITATGLAYELGRGVDRNPEEAAKWYARVQSDALGAYLLSALYFRGEGVPQDRARAFQLMSLAAHKEEVPDAMYWYGVWLGDAEISGDPTDLSESTRWIGKAAEAGFPQARYEYGVRLMEGRGVTADRALALRWFEASSHDGNCSALFQQAYLTTDMRAGADNSAPRAIYERIAADTTTCAEAGLVPSALFNLGVIAESAGDRALARRKYGQALAARSSIAQSALDKLDAQDAAERQAQQNRKLAAENAAAAARAAQAREAQLHAPIGGKGSPSRADILAAHARASVRYFGGRLTSAAGEQTMQSPFGGDMFTRVRSISNASCSPKAAGVWRCAYDMTIRQVANPNSLLGILSSGFTPDTSRRWSYDYVRTRSGWESKGLEVSMAQDAAASRQASTQSSSPSTSCTVVGGASAVYTGGGGMISGLEWDPSIRRPC
jgi:TPR repeat protein